MQLRSIFGCTEEDLRTVLEGSAYIFEQAAYQGMAAEPLYEFLLEAGFEDLHAKVKKTHILRLSVRFLSVLMLSNRRLVGYGTQNATDLSPNCAKRPWYAFLSLSFLSCPLQLQFSPVTSLHHPQGGPGVLSDVDWHLNLTMGESSLSRMNESSAIFDFTVDNLDNVSYS